MTIIKIMEEYNFLKFAYEIADMARINIENFFNNLKLNTELTENRMEVNQ